MKIKKHCCIHINKIYLPKREKIRRELCERFSASAETVDAEDPGILPNGELNRKVQWHVGSGGERQRRENGDEERERARKKRKRKGRVLTRGGRKGRNDWHLGNCLVKTGRSREASNSAFVLFLSVHANTRKSVTKICVR